MKDTREVSFIEWERMTNFADYDNPQCADCSTDTHADHEWYMAEDEVWSQAMLQGHVDFLCIGCLEVRLERKLDFNDFKLVPLNFQFRDRSKRLEDRMDNFVAEKETQFLLLERGE